MKTAGFTIAVTILATGLFAQTDPSRILPPTPTKPTVSGTLTVITPAEVRPAESTPGKTMPVKSPQPQEFEPKVFKPVTLTPSATNTVAPTTTAGWWKGTATNWPAAPKKSADPWK